MCVCVQCGRSLDGVSRANRFVGAHCPAVCVIIHLTAAYDCMPDMTSDSMRYPLVLPVGSTVLRPQAR